MCVSSRSEIGIRIEMTVIISKYRRVLSVILGLLFISSVFTSCKKGTVTVAYWLGLTVEATDPGKITDPGMHDTYETLLRDLIGELAPNTYYFKPYDLVLDKNRVVMIMDSAELGSEDERRITEFNDYLSELKEIETSYRKRIEDLEKRDGVSFCIHVNLLLSRISDDSDPIILREYRFELKYN